MAVCKCGRMVDMTEPVPFQWRTHYIMNDGINTVGFALGTIWFTIKSYFSFILFLSLLISFRQQARLHLPHGGSFTIWCPFQNIFDSFDILLLIPHS